MHLSFFIGKKLYAHNECTCIQGHDVNKSIFSPGFPKDIPISFVKPEQSETEEGGSRNQSEPFGFLELHRGIPYLVCQSSDETDHENGYIYISSPVSLQVLIMVGFFSFLTLVTILAGVDLNSTYASHYLRLNAVMNINEVSADTRQRSRAYREKLKEISHAYKVSFRYVTALDAVNYSKLFGVEISSTLLTFYGTALTSVASMISVAWSAMIEAGYY